MLPSTKNPTKLTYVKFITVDGMFHMTKIDLACNLRTQAGNSFGLQVPSA